jgi:hypothetical protein
MGASKTFRRPVPGWAVVGVFLLASALVSSNAAAGDGISTPALKAAFLFNFAKFVEWPADVLPSGAPILFCITADDQVAKAVVDLVKDHPIEGHAVMTRRTKPEGPFTGCHLLYAAGLAPNQAGDLVRALNNAPVMSVSDLSEFALRGGTANFFVENNKIRFAINTDAAERTRLRVSSRLLSLAKLVKDEAGPSPH